MLTKITKTDKTQPETVEIHCHKISDEVKEIVAFVKSRQGQLTGTLDERQFEIPVGDIFYIEAVDNKTFMYTQKRCTKQNKSFMSLKNCSVINALSEFQNPHYLI